VLERFKQGEARLECDSCSLKFGFAKDELQTLHRKGEWERLARQVLELGYAQDISWYYLGAAAEGLGLTDPARRYYQQAAELARHKDTRCDHGLANLCGDVRVAEAAQTALNRLGR
jgi:Flp pilus assembly protein TadD